MINAILYFARGGFSSSGGHSYSSSYSSSRSSYSSSRSSSSGSYRSTSRTSSSSSYRSTTKSNTTSSSRYTSTYRPSTTKITSSNLYRSTTPQYRTTVYHTYSSDHYWYNGFFHPFGWGYGGGDFWFWMWMFDRPQFNQAQQTIQATPTSVQTPSNSWVGDVFMIGLLISLGVFIWWLIAWWRRHLLYVY